MITKIKSTYHLASCPVIVEFSDDAIIWIKAKLQALEGKTLWPYVATDGNQYKYCREVK